MIKAERAGRRLRDWRKSEGHRQHEVAKLLGVSVSYVSTLEHGRKAPARELAVKIQLLAGIEVAAWQ